MSSKFRIHEGVSDHGNANSRQSYLQEFLFIRNLRSEPSKIKASITGIAAGVAVGAGLQPLLDKVCGGEGGLFQGVLFASVPTGPGKDSLEMMT